MELSVNDILHRLQGQDTYELTCNWHIANMLAVHNCVIVYASSDSLVVVDGLISDAIPIMSRELDSVMIGIQNNNSVVWHVGEYGDSIEKVLDSKNTIAVCKQFENGESFWTVKTKMPCERFTLMNGGKPFSEGLLICLDDAQSK